MRIRSIISLTALLPMLAATVAAQQWEPLDAPHVPSPRAGHSMTEVDGTLYLFGGFGGAGLSFNDLWRWDVGAGDWVELHPINPPSPRYGHAAVAAGGRLWVILGQDGTPNGSIWAYDPAANAWQDETPAGASLVTRIQHAATVVASPTGSDTIYFTGGLSFFFEALTEAWAIDLGGAKSLELRPLPDLPVGLYGHALAPSRPQRPELNPRIVNFFGRTLEMDYNHKLYLELVDVPSEWVDQQGDVRTFTRVSSAPTPDGGVLVCGERTLGGGLETEILVQALSHGDGDVEVETEAMPLLPIPRKEVTCAGISLPVGVRLVAGGGRTEDGTSFHDDYYSYYSGPDPLASRYYVPAANGAGVGTLWTTGWSGVNRSESECAFDVTLFECPRKDAGSCTQQLIVPPGGLFWFDDVLDELFGVTGTFALAVDSAFECLDNLKFISRISSSDGSPDAPTQGQGFTLLGENEITTPDQPSTILELHSCDDFRTNIGLIGACDVATEVRISLFDADTLAFLGDLTVTAQPEELVQINRVFQQAGIPCVANAVALVEVLTDGGCVATYSSVIDNNGQDPTTQLPARPSFDLFIPVVARGPGLEQSTWTTQLAMKPGPGDTEFTTTFYRASDGSVQIVSRSQHTVGAGEVLRTDDVVGDWFESSGSGWVRIEADRAVSATSRTYDTPGGEPGGPTFGQGIPAVPLSDAFGTADRPNATIPGLRRSADPTMGYRSNLILVNLGASDITLEVELVDGGQLVGIRSFTLLGYESRIVTDVFSTVTGGDVTRGRVVVYSATPEGRFFAAGSMVDNQRGDGTWIPGQ